MNILEISNKKANGQTLLREEIEFCVNGYYNNKISKQDMTEFIKSVYNGNMSDEEVYFLTKAMQNTGETCDMSEFLGKSVDKHSTGGVADTTTLIIAPLLASLDIYMLKASGRSLGWTGGTINKLESFEGYKCDLDFETAKSLAKQNGACLVSQSKDLAPADKLIYALRDETGYVDNIALIASSIMSKKLAANNDYIYLDVKVGNGAFMQSLDEAEKLAQLMIKIAKLDGKKCVCFLTNMNEPLGANIGSYIETIEAIEVLNGKEGSLREFVCEFVSQMVMDVKDIDYKKAKELVLESLKSKKALEKLKIMVKSSGGSLKLFENYDLNVALEIKSNQDGYIKEYDCKSLGQISLDMERLESKAGIICQKRIGDKVEKGETLFKIVNYTNLTDNIIEKLLNCVIISSDKVKKQDLIYKVIV